MCLGWSFLTSVLALAFVSACELMAYHLFTICLQTVQSKSKQKPLVCQYSTPLGCGICGKCLPSILLFDKYAEHQPPDLPPPSPEKLQSRPEMCHPESKTDPK